MKSILLFIIGVILLISGSFLFLYTINSPTHIELTECYDRYGNEILGVTCEEVVVDNIGLSIFLGLIVGVIWIIVLICFLRIFLNWIFKESFFGMMRK